MKKIITLAAIAIFTLANAQDGAPASPYYNGFNWTLTGMSLKSALATKITTTHTNQLSYTPGIWNALKIVDLDTTDPSNVFLIYGWENGTDSDVTNDRKRSKDLNGGNSGDWNREHVFAQALGNPDLGQAGPGADAHMLRACDVSRNNTRANKLYAAGSGANSYSVSSSTWYPGDEWKGDIARIIMYMYLRYGTQCLPTYVATGTTVSTDANMPNLLLQWNADDPVSPHEDARNTYLNNASNTYGQGNRNPFIDNPYLATVIWGGPTAQNRWPTIFLGNQNYELEKSLVIYPNPSVSHTVFINTNYTVDTIELLNINGQLVQKIENPTATNTVFTLENIPTGFYFVKVSNQNGVAVRKVIVE